MSPFHAHLVQVLSLSFRISSLLLSSNRLRWREYEFVNEAGTRAEKMSSSRGFWDGEIGVSGIPVGRGGEDGVELLVSRGRSSQMRSQVITPMVAWVAMVIVHVELRQVAGGLNVALA
jgi:hypothetical protein